MLYMGVQLEIVCNLAKDLVKAIENTNEEAIFVFDNSGLFVRMSDIYKYKVLEIEINKEDFINYECDKPVELGIVVSRIKDVTKTLRKGDFLSIHYEEGADVLNLSANGLNRAIKLIDVSHISRIPSLDIHYAYEAMIDHKTFHNFLKASGKTLSFDISTADGGLIMVSETEGGVVQVPWMDSLINSKTYKSKTAFSLSEISKAVSTAKGELKVSGKENEIIKFSWNIAENSRISAMVAPKV